LFCNRETSISLIPDMFLLQQGQHYLAMSCFEETYPNQAFVYSILHNRMPGLVFVDNLIRPNYAIILTEEPFGFVSKNFDFEVLNNLCSHLKNKSNINFKLVFDQSVLNQELSCLEALIIPRKAYSLKPADFYEIQITPNQDLGLQLINSELFKDCHLKGRLYNMYQTKEYYLNHALGACLLSGGQILSEAHAIIADNICELGVFTHENYRKQGFSKMVCHFLINECLSKNYIIQWTCNEDNLASMYLAESLGFKADYAFLSLSFN